MDSKDKEQNIESPTQGSMGSDDNKPPRQIDLTQERFNMDREQYVESEQQTKASQEIEGRTQEINFDPPEQNQSVDQKI